MTLRIHRTAAALAFALAFSSCKSGGDDKTTPTELVAVTASQPSVFANGVNTVSFHVTSTGSGPISVTTDRGTFQDSGSTATSVPGTSGDVVLVTCDAVAAPACAGPARVTARRPGTAAQATVAFGGVELCSSACGVDASCAGRACTSGGTTGTCQGSPLTCQAPQCQPTAATESSCSGGVDEDCNGQADCADTACDGQPCNPLSATSACQGGACVDLASGYAVTIGSTATRLAANGSATATVTATVRRNGVVAAGVSVDFTATAGLGSVSPASGVTGADGKAVAIFTAGTSAGTSTVTAALHAVPVVNASVAIALPALGQIAISTQQYQVMGVRFSGYHETSQLTFQVLDTGGLAYPPGLQVGFAHERLGDSYLGIAPDCVGGPPASCLASGVTDAAGKVAVLLTSGRVAGVVSVTGTATAGGATVSGTAGNLAIIGAKASGAHITLSCSPKNVPALTNDDCSFSHYGGAGSTVTCTATFADRFNNVLGVSTLVTFATEAGAAGQPATTPAYDPTKAPTSQGNLGIATNIINVNGGKVPKDVVPFAGELAVAHDLDGCGNGSNLVHNPRDGLVTIIATAIGEEGFADLNGNGQYDPGEPFIDLGEPYIDENDNGAWESGEPFVDANSNNTYDGPDGVWDSNKVIWAETRILYSGYAAQVATTGNALSRFYEPLDAAPLPTAPASFLVTSSASTNASDPHPVVLMDRNLNQLTPGTSYSLSTLTGKVSASFTSALGVVDNLGMNLTQLYCDHPTSPTSCGNTCATSPCYVVTNIGGCNLPARDSCSGFSYGNWGVVNITGSCNTSSTSTDWPETLRLTATLASVPSIVTIGGVCQDR